MRQSHTLGGMLAILTIIFPDSPCSIQPSLFFLTGSKTFVIFFSCNSIGFPCPGNFNPVDFFIRTLTVNPTEYEQSVERIKVR